MQFNLKKFILLLIVVYNVIIQYPVFSIKLQVFHSCDGEVWEPRGEIYFKSEKSTSGEMTQDSFSVKIKNFLRQNADNNLFYHVKIISELQITAKIYDESKNATYVHSFSRARSVFCSDFTGTILIYTNTNGHIFTINEHFKKNCQKEDYINTYSSKPSNSIRDKMTTDVRLIHSQYFAGPEPDVDIFLKQKVIEKEKNETEDRSFLMRYWPQMVMGLIVYMVISMLFQGGGGEERSNEGSGS